MKRTSDRATIALVALLGCAVLGMVYYGEASASRAMIQERGLYDPDSFMWLTRATQLHESGNWYNHTISRINPPGGHEQHWTRPMDALLLAGGTLLAPALGFDRGLYSWGLVLSPLTHVLTMLVMLWAALPLVRRRMAPRSAVGVVVLVFAVQLPLYQSFLLGSADHQLLLALLYASFLGFFIRALLSQEHGRRFALGLGVVGGIALWVSVESLLFVGLGGIGLGLAWLQGGEAAARRNLVTGLSLLLTVVVALVAERGLAGFGLRATDTLSVAHVGLAIFVALSALWIWLTEHLGGTKSAASKIFVAFLGVLALLVALLVVFPEFLRGPLGDVDPLYRATRLTHIVELKPLGATGSGAIGYASALVLFAWIAMPTIPYLAVRLRAAQDPNSRAVWLTLLLSTLTYLALSLGQKRWSPYLSLTCVIPYALFARTAADALKRKAVVSGFSAPAALVLAGLLLGHILVGGGGLKVAGLRSEEPSAAADLGQVWEADSARAEIRVPPHPPDDRTGCNLALAAGILTDPRHFNEAILVLAWADYGPELLYRTPHSVLSIPNHRYQPGYRYSYEVMVQHDPVIAGRLLRARGVGAVLFCAKDLGGGFAFRGVATSRSAGKEEFAQWLASGGVPEGYRLHASTDGFRILRRVSGRPDSGEHQRPGEG